MITGSSGADRHRAVHQQDRAQGLVHRLDRGRQDPAQAVRRHGQADLDGAGRPRAVHRLRRRRPRQGGRGGDRLQVPQHRPDLRLHQPDLRPGRRLRRLRREVRGRRRPSCKVGPGTAKDVDHRPADRRRRGRRRSRSMSPTPPPRAPRSCSAASATSSAASSSSPPCSPTATQDMKVAHEETFGPVAPLFRFETEEEVIRLGQRHRCRPRRLLLRPRHRPRLPRRRGARGRHGRRQ